MTPTIHPKLVGVDLTRPNRVIGEETGLSEHYIRQARKALGVPAPNRAGSGKLGCADLTLPTHVLVRLTGATPSAIRSARHVAGIHIRSMRSDVPRKSRAKNAPLPSMIGPRRPTLDEVDLTLSISTLVALTGRSKSSVGRARRAAGLTVERPVAKGRTPRVKPPPIPRINKPAPTREIHVPAPPPMVAEADVVAALTDELVVCRSAYSAALVVASRLKRPVDELLTVAERLMGRAA